MVNFSTNNQFKSFINGFQGDCFKKIHEVSEEYPALIKISALPIAFAHHSIEVAGKISRIAESVIKGLGNILGSPFTDQCNFARGLNLLVVKAPKYIIILPFYSVVAAFSAIADTFKLISDPCRYSELLWLSVDPERHNAHHFNKALEAYDQNPNDPVANRKLAKCYDLGTGTEPNAQKAFELYRSAANAGDTESMWALANLLISTNNVDDAMPWLERAAENGHVSAMIKAANIYENSKMFAKALDYYFKAAESGNLDSMVKYVLLRFDVKYKNIPFNEDVHTPMKASEFLTHAALKHSGEAVTLFTFMVFMKCANVADHPQQWDVVMHDDTKAEILNNLTPDMFKAAL